MSRHAFRWQGAAFGTLLIAIAAGWTVWQTDLVTPREFNLTLSIALMVAGVLGIAATLARRSPSPTIPTHPSPEVPDEQEADPQH